MLLPVDVTGRGGQSLTISGWIGSSVGVRRVYGGRPYSRGRVLKSVYSLDTTGYGTQCLPQETFRPRRYVKSDIPKEFFSGTLVEDTSLPSVQTYPSPSPPRRDGPYIDDTFTANVQI